MNVPFLDLKAINARHAAELKAATARVIDSGWYVLGEEVKAFESEFATWVCSPHCVGTSDGLSAPILALRGWKELGLLKDGDGVAVPANTYIASILAITENRLRPVLVEPDEDTFNLGAAKLAAALTPDVKAVLAVHLYGQLADMPAIAQLCRERGLLLLEDAAQSHGAHIGGVKAGAWGDAAAFSFYPGKNLGALGDGGLVGLGEVVGVDGAVDVDDLVDAGGGELSSHGGRVVTEHEADDLAAGKGLRLLGETDGGEGGFAELAFEVLCNDENVAHGVSKESNCEVKGGVTR